MLWLQPHKIQIVEKTSSYEIQINFPEEQKDIGAKTPRQTNEAHSTVRLKVVNAKRYVTHIYSHNGFVTHWRNNLTP